MSKPCPKSAPPVKSDVCETKTNFSRVNSFTNKLLLCMNALQGIRRYHDGASVSDIEKYMKNKFPVDGDVRSQIKTGLLHLGEAGLVRQKCNKYLSLLASVTVQAEDECKKRDAEMERFTKIFNSRWLADDTGLKICRARHCKKKSRSKSRSCTDSSKGCGRRFSDSFQSETNDTNADHILRYLKDINKIGNSKRCKRTTKKKEEKTPSQSSIGSYDTDFEESVSDMGNICRREKCTKYVINNSCDSGKRK